MASSSFYWITLVVMATAVAAAPQLTTAWTEQGVTMEQAAAGSQLAATRTEQQTRREQFARVICGDLSPDDCKAKIGICNPGRYLEIKDSTVLKSCFEQNGLKLQGAPDAVKTIDEVLSFLGASNKALHAARNCFYTNLGLMSNDVFIVEAVKAKVQSTIQEKITNSSLKAAMLGALDKCPQPTGHSIRPLLICLVKTCAGQVANI